MSQFFTFTFTFTFIYKATDGLDDGYLSIKSQTSFPLPSPALPRPSAAYLLKEACTQNFQNLDSHPTTSAGVTILPPM